MRNVHNFCSKGNSFYTCSACYIIKQKKGNVKKNNQYTFSNLHEKRNNKRGSSIWSFTCYIKLHTHFLPVSISGSPFYWCEMLEMCVRVGGGHTIHAFQLMRLRIYISSLLIPFFMNTTFHLRHEFDVPASCIFPQLPSTTHTRKFRFSTFLALSLNELYIYIYIYTPFITFYYLNCHIKW